jgi:hypothetical protein
MIFKEDEIEKYDIVVLQRQYDKRILDHFKKLKQENSHIKLIYEIDDCFHEIPEWNPCYKHYPKNSDRLKNIIEFSELCDMMTVTTENLKNEFIKYNKNIFVFENYIPKEIFGELKENEIKDEIRIGWAGSATHLEDIKILIEPLTCLFREDPRLKLVLLGFDYTGLFHGIPRERKEFILGTLPKKEEYQKTLQELFDSSKGINFIDLFTQDLKYDAVGQYYKILKDANIHIGLAPLTMNKFNACKSSIKLKEYVMAGIPYVASPSTDYIKFNSIDFYKATKTCGGLIANDTKEWKKYIKYAIENKDRFLENQNKIRESIYLSNNINKLNDKIINL